MITVYNAENYAQQWFFDKAFQTLLKLQPNALTDKEKAIGAFTSLDGYFAHMKDLIQLSPSFAMIPSDEEPFVIDANARTIAVPASFNKCASVAGDTMCEIATFTIDRYYDYVDLATTHICVQWSIKGREGISQVTLIDTDTIPGKIRFGWPLTSAMTEESGVLTFAVRFFIDVEETDAEGNKRKRLAYVLNTLPTSIAIKDSLQIDAENAAVVKESSNDPFSTFIRNSSNPSYPEAAGVTWGAPGKDLAVDSPAKINAEDTLVLRAQGIVTDNGYIDYAWYFVDGDAKTVQKIVGDANDPKYEITEEYVPVNRALGRQGSKQYYLKDVMKNIAAYENIDSTLPDFSTEPYEILIGSAFPTEAEVIARFAERYPEAETDLFDTNIYERFSVLRIRPADENDTDTDWEAVTGTYYVEGTNYVGETYCALGKDPADETKVVYVEARNRANAVPSSDCLVLTPIDVKFTDNLDVDKKLVSDKVELKVETAKDGGEPELTYNWYYSATKLEQSDIVKDGVIQPVPASAQLIKGGADAAQLINRSEYTATEPGWYYVLANSKLNRKNKQEVTNVCRITEATAKPNVVATKWIKWESDMTQEDFDKSNEWNPSKGMEEAVHITNTPQVRLQVDLAWDADKDMALQTDTVEYEWWIITPDNGAQKLLDGVDNIADDSGCVLAGQPVDKNYLDVHVRWTTEGHQTFYCVVKNTLANETAEFGLDDYESNTDDNLTVFKVW
jgi:hypothetical protein